MHSTLISEQPRVELFLTKKTVKLNNYSRRYLQKKRFNKLFTYKLLKKILLRNRKPKISKATNFAKLLILPYSLTHRILNLYTGNKVCQGGTDITLTKIRLKYWLIKSRQTVRQIISPCVSCEGGEVLRPPPLTFLL